MPALSTPWADLLRQGIKPLAHGEPDAVELPSLPADMAAIQHQGDITVFPERRGVPIFALMCPVLANPVTGLQPWRPRRRPCWRRSS